MASELSDMDVTWRDQHLGELVILYLHAKLGGQRARGARPGMAWQVTGVLPTAQQAAAGGPAPVGAGRLVNVAACSSNASAARSWPHWWQQRTPS